MPFDGSDKIFKTPEDLQDKFKEYIANCPNAIPSIVGFTTYCGINRDTFYGYKEYEGYVPTLKNIEDILETAAIDKMFTAKNPMASIAYLNNKFGWSSKVDVKTDIKTTSTVSDIDTKAILDDAIARMKNK